MTAVEAGTAAEGSVTQLTGRPRIGASSCLLGEPVRFNAGHSRCRFLTDGLAPYVDWIPYCPEMAIGLGTPRETLRLTTNGRLVNLSGTADHTLAMTALPLPSDLDGYVFKAKSPSCGVHGIARYNDNGQPTDHRGLGVFAARVMAGFPLLRPRTRAVSTTRCCGRRSPSGSSPPPGCENCFAPVETTRTGRLPHAAQAAATRSRPDPLPAGRPDCRRHGPRSARADRGGLPRAVPGGDGLRSQPRAQRQRAAARLKPDQPGNRQAAAGRSRRADRDVQARP